MTIRNGNGEHERGMDPLQKWTIVALLLTAAGMVFLRLGIERIAR